MTLRRSDASIVTGYRAARQLTQVLVDDLNRVRMVVPLARNADEAWPIPARPLGLYRS